jgi:hypothetical protein
LREPRGIHALRREKKRGTVAHERRGRTSRGRTRHREYYGLFIVADERNRRVPRLEIIHHPGVSF